MSRLLALFGVVSSLLFSAFDASGAAGVTEVPLAVRSVVYDSFTDKLYVSAGNNLLQLDPLSGTMLKSFFLGTNVTLLSLGAENGIWTAIDGEQSICRFDLATLTAGDKVVVSISGRSILDLYGSMTDPTLALVCLPTVTGRWAEALVVRNGLALPGSRTFPGNINVPIYGALRGTSAYLSYSGSILKLAVGANGLVDLNLVSGSPKGNGVETVRVLDSNLYCGAGFALDANSLTSVTNFDTFGLVAVNATENAVYYLTSTFNAPVVTRFAHPSLQKTATAELGGISSAGLRSLAGYRNHVAFNNASTLYIVDLEKVANVRPPAQLDVVQSAPESIQFGEMFELWVYITNRGPSTAQVTLTDSISSGTAYSTYGWITAETPIVQPAPPGILPPGQGFSYVIIVQPPTSGAFTNTILLTSTNTEPAQTVSTEVINVVPPSGPVTTIVGLFPNCVGCSPGYGNDTAYDPKSGKLFAMSAAQMRAIDPQTPALLSFLRDNGSGRVEPVSSGGFLFRDQGVGGIESSAAGGVLFIQSVDGRSIQRMNTTDFTLSGFVVTAGPVLDVLASPIDTNLIALVSATGTELIRNGLKLANSTSDTGSAQFSADGSKLYLMRDADCVLDIFNVDQNGLTLAQTRTNASCSTFTEADGLIYFSTGTIYDPVTDKRSSLGLTPPVFVISRGNQLIDTLARTNNTWTVQRLGGPDHHLIRSVAVTKLSPSVGIFQFKPAGPDRVAMISGNTLYLVNLGAPSQLSVGASLRDPATVALRIDSTADAVYRIETASTPGAGTWTTVQDNIAGTGGIIETPVPIQAQQNAFFRAVRQSP